MGLVDLPLVFVILLSFQVPPEISPTPLVLGTLWGTLQWILTLGS